MLELKDITLNFTYKSVLKGVNATFQNGKIYSLLGENGAGKSTLARIICGDIKQTSGEIILDGKKINFTSPKNAIKNGICLVHQRPLLASEVSIKENLKLGNKKYSKSQKNELLQKYLPNISENTLVTNLTPSQCFFTALICALLKNPKILILDEPSDTIKQTLRSLAEQRLIIIIITHNLQEALTVADDVILLKDGEIIQNTPVEQTSEEEIKTKLYGISERLSISKNIITAQINENLILQARKTKGYTKNIGYIPSDKTFRASNPRLTILQMLTAFHTSESEVQLKARAQEILKKVDVNIGLSELCSNLSGGMLQRLILEREIVENPKTLFLFNPTHGLDLEATQKLYSRLDYIAQQGTTVIIAG